MGYPIVALSVAAIKTAEIRGKAYKLSDRDGRYLLVTPSAGALSEWWESKRLSRSGFGPIPASQKHAPNGMPRERH